jgi:hypothetical protein
VGTPTVSISEVTEDYGYLAIARYNGFVGTPTVDTSMNLVFTGTGTSISCSQITTNFTNELLLVGMYSSSGFSIPSPTGWTPFNAVEYGTDLYYAVEPTSGTTNNFVGALGSSVSWNVITVGIYDATGGPNTATIAWIK